MEIMKFAAISLGVITACVRMDLVKTQPPECVEIRKYHKQMYIFHPVVHGRPSITLRAIEYQKAQGSLQIESP